MYFILPKTHKENVLVMGNDQIFSDVPAQGIKRGNGPNADTFR